MKQQIEHLTRRLAETGAASQAQGAWQSARIADLERQLAEHVNIAKSLGEERDGLEAQLRQAQKMEAVGRLAGGIAHDFNNILTIILNYCQFLLADLTLADPARTDIQEISKAAKRAVALSQHLMMFSRQQGLEPQNGREFP